MKAMTTTTCVLLLSALSLSAQAELKPMDDASMEDTVGQAYIEMDSYLDTNSNQVSRVTFGQDIKVQTNIDSITLGGGYDNGSGLGTDFSATHFSLGYINGSNDIVPFTFTNPYIEWVTDATNNIVGFRVGADEAKGILQANWSSFSGNIDMTVNGAEGHLFNGTGGTQTGNRATHISDNNTACTDTTDCIGLDQLLSLSVADSDGTSTADFFLAFQKNAITWNTSSGTQAASKGFFMNIPTDNVITTSGAGAGTLGYTVEFIDRGIGRWHWFTTQTTNTLPL